MKKIIKLEEIPEMMVRESDIYEAYNLDSKPLSFRGKFIVLEGPEFKRYIVTQRTSVSSDSHAFIEGSFLAYIENYCDLERRPGCLFKTLSGGWLELKDNIIEFSETSTRFGKYDKAIVRPIAERFRDKYIPGASIECE